MLERVVGWRVGEFFFFFFFFFRFFLRQIALDLTMQPHPVATPDRVPPLDAATLVHPIQVAYFSIQPPARTLRPLDATTLTPVAAPPSPPTWTPATPTLWPPKAPLGSLPAWMKSWRR